MKTIIKSFLAIMSFSLLFSCGQTISHDKELAYYVTCATVMKNTTTTVNAFWDQLLQAAETAKENQDMKLDSASIDTLNKSYDVATTALTSAIAKLISVVEIDQNINLKEKTLTYIKETKILHQTALPRVIEALKNGLGQVKGEQKDAFLKFKEKATELQSASIDVNKLALDFQDKHHITNDELTKNGL